MPEYNQSENARRSFKAFDLRTSMGRSNVQIKCPFCGTQFTAYIWSISGGGKKCTNKKCGAMHTSFGQAIPVAGREDMQP